MAASSTGENLTFLFSASMRLDAAREWDHGGPIQGHHTARVIAVGLVIGEQIAKVVSCYAPQTGRSQIEKDEY